MIWVILVLILGGGMLGLLGQFWEMTAKLLKFFEVELNAGAGTKAAFIGYGMFFVGLALAYAMYSK